MTSPGEIPHFVYRCFDAEDRLLYVGCSNCPPLRLEGHESVAWWWPDFAYVRNTVYPNKEAALARERIAIFEEMPRCNVKGRWLKRDPRGDWSAQDYVDFHHAILQMAENNIGVHTSKLLRRVEAEISARHGVVISQAWKDRWTA